jgi:hypothetical protein
MFLPWQRACDRCHAVLVQGTGYSYEIWVWIKSKKQWVRLLIVLQVIVFGGITILALISFGLLDNVIAIVFNRKKLRPYEQFILESWRAQLSAENKMILDAQMDRRRVVDRGYRGYKGGPIASFFYWDEPSLPRFGNKLADQKVSTVILRDRTNTKNPPLKAKIFIHSGELFFIEFAKLPEWFNPKRSSDLDRIYVERIVSHVSVDSPTAETK